MFGGRDYDYVTVVAPGAPVTVLGSSGDTRRTPAIAGSLLPVAAALLAFAFFARLAASALRRPGGQKVLWALGFLLFAVAATAEALAHRSGWTPALFRTYYAAGGVLTVACLGAGSAWLQLPRRARDVMIGALGLASIAAVITVVLAPVDSGLLAAAPSGQPPANAALGGHAFLWAIALNSFGTLFLVGGSLYSIVRRRRVRVNLWIGTGALVVALATGLSRAGSYDFVYAGELLGIALMFSGFTFAGKAPAPRADRAVRRDPALVGTPATR
jgi:MFS family permease